MSSTPKIIGFVVVAKAVTTEFGLMPKGTEIKPGHPMFETIFEQKNFKLPGDESKCAYLAQFDETGKDEKAEAKAAEEAEAKAAAEAEEAEEEDADEESDESDESDATPKRRKRRA